MAIDPKRSFAQRNPQTGLLEIVDIFTGEVKATEEVPGMREARLTYSEVMADLICNAVAEGGSLTKICKMKGFPSYVQVCHWRRQYPEFEEALVRARQDRAEALRDEAMSIADDAAEEGDAINKARLRTDIRKWSSAVDDPSRYSPKTKVDATLTTPMTLVVRTGIDRTPLETLGPGPGDQQLLTEKNIGEGNGECKNETNTTGADGCTNGGDESTT